MKIIYQKIINLISEVPAIRFTDLDKGQLEIGNTAVALPCCLINIDLADCEDLTDKIQRVQAKLLLRIGFDYTGQTSAATPENIRDESLAFFDTIEQIYAKLQGYTDDNIETIGRSGMHNEQRADGLKVVQLEFDCWFDDETADQ